jgi:hypothetical protein
VYPTEYEWEDLVAGAGVVGVEVRFDGGPARLAKCSVALRELVVFSQRYVENYAGVVKLPGCGVNGVGEHHGRRREEGLFR